MVGGAIGQLEPEADAGVGVELLELAQARHLVAEVVEGLAELARAVLDGVHDRAHHRVDHVAHHVEDGLEVVGLDLEALDLVIARVGCGPAGLGSEELRAGLVEILPVDPLRDGGPGRAHRRRADHETKVPGREGDAVDLAQRGGFGDRADRGFAGDLVALTVETQDRQLELREADRAPGDDEAPRAHAVGDDEFIDESAQSRAGPGHEALSAEETTAALALEQRVTIVELGHELGDLLELLADREDLEARRGQDSGEAVELGEGLGDSAAGRADHSPSERCVDGWQVAVNVDGAAEGDEGGDILALAVGRGLVAEHPALGVAEEVDRPPRLGRNRSDRVVDREHVVIQGALEAPRLTLGGAKIDDPHIDARVEQRRDTRDIRGDVVDLRGHHQGRDEEGGPGLELAPFMGRGVVTQAMVPAGVYDLVGAASAVTEPPKLCDLLGIVDGGLQTAHALACTGANTSEWRSLGSFRHGRCAQGSRCQRAAPRAWTLLGPRARGRVQCAGWLAIQMVFVASDHHDLNRVIMPQPRRESLG